MKNRILNGEEIELENELDCVTLFKGHQDRFCLMLNSKVIKSTKGWNPIQDKLDRIGNLTEVLCQ